MNSQKPWQKKTQSVYRKPPIVDENKKSVSIGGISDEYVKELGKNDINVHKWYHKLLIGSYYKENGQPYYDDTVLRRLATEYQRAFHSHNIDTLVLIKNELINHLPESLWIDKYLRGEVYNKDGKRLIDLDGDLRELSQEYIRICEEAREKSI